MKKKKNVILILLLFIFILIIAIFDATWIEPNHLEIQQLTIQSTKIPDSLKNMKIGYFSDIQYGSFLKEKRLTTFIQQMNQQMVDVIVFGGDVFDGIPDEQQIQTVTQQLSQLNAPYGKFAVLGDQDIQDETQQQIVQQVLTNAGFEILSQQVVNLHKEASPSITIVGVSPQPENFDFMSTIDPNQLVIGFMHYPDMIDQLPIHSLDYAFSGHTLGGQIDLGLVYLNTPEHGTHYIAGHHQVGQTMLYINQGLGTKHYDIRFMTRPQYTIMTLQ